MLFSLLLFHLFSTVYVVRLVITISLLKDREKQAGIMFVHLNGRDSALTQLPMQTTNIHPRITLMSGFRSSPSSSLSCLISDPRLKTYYLILVVFLCY